MFCKNKKEKVCMYICLFLYTPRFTRSLGLRQLFYDKGSERGRIGGRTYGQVTLPL